MQVAEKACRLLAAFVLLQLTGLWYHLSVQAKLANRVETVVVKTKTVMESCWQQ